MDKKQLAKEFVLPYFNLRESLFNAAWDYIDANFDKVSAAMSSGSGQAVEKTGIPLSLGGEEQRGAVKAIIIFADGFKEMPLEGDFSSLVDSIKSACGKYHAEEGLAKEILKKVNSLENRIEKFLKPDVIKKVRVGKEAEGVEYAIFLSAPGGIGTIRDKDTKTEIQFQEKYAKRKEKYDIFIYDQTIYKKVLDKGKAKMVLLNPGNSTRGLLILFLKYKDAALPYVELYHKAFSWKAVSGETNVYHDGTAKLPEDVMNTLKNAVNELKREFDYIKGFSIPRAKNSTYKCEGDFEFCLILKKATNEQYTMLFEEFKTQSIPEEA